MKVAWGGGGDGGTGTFFGRAKGSRLNSEPSPVASSVERPPSVPFDYNHRQWPAEERQASYAVTADNWGFTLMLPMPLPPPPHH